MVSSWILLLVSLGYAALLFGVAWWGDHRPLYPERPWLRPAVYSLALAVYCSSWTFYGAVGSAVRNGIGYLPIYLVAPEKPPITQRPQGLDVCSGVPELPV
ncbi:hypothetical protein, partial [Xanthomonas campestris]|uniref:hypothetical protein n=1 Tax=Xanthomonas campestris TaxID=339 RepID=UPI0032E4853C